jgi:hypothetical protein
MRARAAMPDLRRVMLPLCPHRLEFAKRPRLAPGMQIKISALRRYRVNL